MLSAEGMSTRAIAPIVGASQKTVARDVATESFDSVERITGINGKTYTRPEPNESPGAYGNDGRGRLAPLLCGFSDVPGWATHGNQHTSSINLDG